MKRDGYQFDVPVVLSVMWFARVLALGWMEVDLYDPPALG